MVAELLVAEGDTVAVGTLIIRIAGAGEAPGAVVTGEVQDSNGEPALAERRAARAARRAVRDRDAGRLRREGRVGDQPASAQGHARQRPSRTPTRCTIPTTPTKPVSRRIDEVTPSAELNRKPVGDTLPPPGRPPAAAQIRRPPLAKPPVRRIARDLGVDLSR